MFFNIQSLSTIEVLRRKSLHFPFTSISSAASTNFLIEMKFDTRITCKEVNAEQGSEFAAWLLFDAGIAFPFEEVNQLVHFSLVQTADLSSYLIFTHFSDCNFACERKIHPGAIDIPSDSLTTWINFRAMKKPRERLAMRQLHDKEIW